MHKLTIALINATAPLDQIVFIGERIKDIYMKDLDDFENIIEEAISFLNTIEGANKTIVHVKVFKEDNSIVLRGIFQEGKFAGGIKSLK